MNSSNKYYFLRMGGVAERKYIFRAISLFDGINVRANFYEIAKEFLNGIFLQLSSLTQKKSYFIDPITYVYGLAPDPEGNYTLRSWQKVDKEKAIEKLMKDLKLKDKAEINPKWIRKVEPWTKSSERKVEVLSIKNAYRTLADTFYVDEIASFAGKNKINLSMLKETGNIADHIKKVIDYQVNLLMQRFSDDKYEDFKKLIPNPAFILSPYYLIHNSDTFKMHTELWQEFENQYTKENAAIVVLCDYYFLKENLNTFVGMLTTLKTANIFYWIDNFKESTNDEEEIETVLKFVMKVSSIGKNVFNLYPGGFSTYLLPFGLTGLVDSPGYGLDRQVAPIQGGRQTAQYYIPSLHCRKPVLQSFDLISENGQGKSKTEFHNQICNCPICKGVIKKGSIDITTTFGRSEENKLTGRYGSPTDAMEQCNFHFILSRLMQFNDARNSSPNDIIKKLELTQEQWSKNSLNLVNWMNSLRKVSGN